MSARHAVTRALANPAFVPYLTSPHHVIAVGKAASAMATAIVSAAPSQLRAALAIGTHRLHDMPSIVEWHEASHPIPDERSVTAGRRALQMAAQVRADESLILLLSGGASALMAVPVDGVTLVEKQQIINRMLLGGADIHALNTVRKHLSLVKGGRLAAACPGTTITLAVSDVVGDDLSVIGSGPGVADPTTIADAEHALQAFAASPPVLFRETPKPGDPALARAHAVVIASRRHALEAARTMAESLGCQVLVVEQEVTGEARSAAREWIARASALKSSADHRPLCILSAGETTVRVVGRGRGGRNQEFALALVEPFATVAGEVIAASVGTDGIDGPTDAAGALVDNTTQDRAVALGLDPRAFLADNNAYEFFANIGDLIHLGRTDTNVGDVQVLLCAPDTRLQ